MLALLRPSQVRGYLVSIEGWKRETHSRVGHHRLKSLTAKAMRQRILGWHTLPCHRRMVITTLSSTFCLAAPQRRPDQCQMLSHMHHSRWLSNVLQEGGRRVTRCYTLWRRGRHCVACGSHCCARCPALRSMWVSDTKSGIIVRFMAVSIVRASAEKIETGESSLDKLKRWGGSVGESGAVILGRGAEGVLRCSVYALGVPKRGKRRCIRLPFSASWSALLLSSMVTCDGTLTQWRVRPGRSNSVSSCSHRGTS